MADELPLPAKVGNCSVKALVARYMACVQRVLFFKLPSEALPACKGSPSNPEFAAKQTLIWRESDNVCLRLLRRKNKPFCTNV